MDIQSLRLFHTTIYILVGREIVKVDFDENKYIERNKQTAYELFGDRLNRNREIEGTKYYFDSMWRLCKRGDIYA